MIVYLSKYFRVWEDFTDILILLYKLHWYQSSADTDKSPDTIPRCWKGIYEPCNGIHSTFNRWIKRDISVLKIFKQLFWVMIAEIQLQRVSSSDVDLLWPGFVPLLTSLLA